MDKDTATSRLQTQRSHIGRLQSLKRGSADFKKWYRDTTVAIRYIFGEDHHLTDFEAVRFSPSVSSSGTPDSYYQNYYVDGLSKADAVLESLVDEISTYWDTAEPPTSAPLQFEPISRIERVCQRFPLVARQLRHRHEGRQTLDIDDEYDVQDLLHALLHIDFDDIRAEEWTPSYAGSASRMDFLLKSEHIVVEVKKTRKGLEDKQVGEQLIIDIQRYQAHPECGVLVCFVYDPDMRISNPRGLEQDLTRLHENLDVHVFVVPRGL